MADEGAPHAWLRVRTDALLDPERPNTFLRLRSVTTALEGHDGWLSSEGTWDFVERPHGLDAVIVVVFRGEGRGVEVLLRAGVRVPVALGRPGAPRGPGRHPARFVEELVAGVIESGEVGEGALIERARLEIEEEAGLQLDASAITRLGAPMWSAPGLLPEVLHYYAADAGAATQTEARGDGSPFEALARLSWRPLDVAIAAMADPVDEVGDLRAELGLRRLRARLDGAVTGPRR